MKNYKGKISIHSKKRKFLHRTIFRCDSNNFSRSSTMVIAYKIKQKYIPIITR